MSKITITLDHDDGNYSSQQLESSTIGIYEAMVLLQRVMKECQYNIPPTWADNAYIAHSVGKGETIEEACLILSRMRDRISNAKITTPT